MTAEPGSRGDAGLTRVYWVGGGSGSGKSTIARRLAEHYGLQLYSTDEVMADHGGRLTPERAPALAKFLAMDMDERWVERSPQEMLDSFHWFRGEGFHLILEDLRALAANGPVVAEGFRLLPELVAPVLTERTRAVWLLPSPEFRRIAFESRGSLWTIAGRTTRPERALANLLERDRLFTDRLRHATTSLGLPAIELDGSVGADALTARVARAFGLGDGTGQPNFRL